MKHFKILSLLLLATLFKSVACASDATSYSPGQYRLNLEQERRSLVTIGIPLKPLEYLARKSLEEAGKNSGDTPFGVLDAGFRDFTAGSRAITYYAHLDGKINSIGQGFNCKVAVRLAIPRRPLLQIMTQDVNSTVDCQTGAWINIQPLLGGILTSTIRDAITKQLIDPLQNETKASIAELKAEDPDLFSLLEDAQVQGTYCNTTGGQGLCLLVGWGPYYRLESYFNGLIANAPLPLGRIGDIDFLALARQFASNAPRKKSELVPNFTYPAKLQDGHPEDGDMAIFGGLLCLSGLMDGCELLKHSQGPNGRFWRAPDNVGRIYDGANDSSAFSGDQFTGVLAYLTKSKDQTALRNYLAYISTNKVATPFPEAATDYAYRTCTDDKKNNDRNCLLGGAEWYWLNKLARELLVDDAIPSDMKNPEATYGFTLDNLMWQAAFAPRGYMLHLVGVQVLIGKRLGIKDTKLSKIAGILASRDSENPFFLYLHLGADLRVLKQVESKCSIKPTQSQFSQWSWERSSLDRDDFGVPPWDHSMLWDCSFIYHLLASET